MEYVGKKIAETLTRKFLISYENITERSHFVKDLGFDSLDFALLIQELENLFDISITEKEAARMQTVGSAIDCIEYKISIFSLFR
ncbi:acyl carrier protein [Flexibacter flexilis DSM 6793]|uniref:Acyl carrier protein n=1 Tax=Flexibacter flexilis DSM 6793 TaxID=927664 RepID=A0A1I1H9L8_9BACT|nr:acyl carrier protein [Flexibacter flexilis]SFC20405.1 acyl carrier protein [Flexibacter flexilis DSM 6793]